MHSEEPRRGLLREIRLIAIPPPDTPASEFVALCRAAERGGATAIQVRLKNRAASQVLSITDRLVSNLAIPIYVNDRADIARVAGAAGAHIGADDLIPETIRTVLPRPYRVGVSVGNQAEAAAAGRADADYWSVGPFRATKTKADAGSALGVAGLKELAGVCPRGVAVVAIGGIAIDNVMHAFRAGAQGVATINGIFGQPDVERATRALRDILDEL